MLNKCSRLHSNCLQMVMLQCLRQPITHSENYTKQITAILSTVFMLVVCITQNSLNCHRYFHPKIHFISASVILLQCREQFKHIVTITLFVSICCTTLTQAAMAEQSEIYCIDISAICKHAIDTEVVDCHGQTFPHRNNSAPFLHLLQQRNLVQPVDNTEHWFQCIIIRNAIFKPLTFNLIINYDSLKINRL